MCECHLSNRVNFQNFVYCQLLQNLVSFYVEHFIQLFFIFLFLFYLFIYFIFSVLCVCGSFELLNLALFSLTLYQCNSCFLFLSLLFSSFYFL